MGVWERRILKNQSLNVKQALKRIKNNDALNKPRHTDVTKNGSYQEGPEGSSDLTF